MTTSHLKSQHLSSNKFLTGLFLGVLMLQIASVCSWAPALRRIETHPPRSERHDHHNQHNLYHQIAARAPRKPKSALNVFQTKDKTASEAATTTKESPSSSTPTNKISDIEQTTESYGLEAGLFQSLKQNDGGQSAKDLLAKYGVAYLATSIPLAIVSFGLCYLLVDSGVDVAALLSNVGIEVNESGEKVGTFALAYAAHKAASPIRFPPTVLLTPVVAKMIGKEPEVESERDL